MSQWLKWRLIALFCAVTLCGGATYLQAQNDDPAPSKTPEEAGEKFLTFLLTRTPRDNDFSMDTSNFIGAARSFNSSPKNV